jgi:5-methylcytosine-specific restriction endonuclease McrA
MPYVTKPRPYKKEYQQLKERGELPVRKKRRAARDAYDKAGINRTGKDIDHKKPLSLGGGNSKSNLRLTTPSANRSFARTSNNKPKKGS